MLGSVAVISFCMFSFAAVGNAAKSAGENEVFAWENASDREAAAWDAGQIDDAYVSPSGITVKESIIYDGNGITITVRGYEDTGYSKQFKVLVENTSGRDALLTCNAFIVNGITVRNSMFIEVKDGKKVNEYFSLYEDTLEMNGIKEIATISTFQGQILDPASYDRIADFDFEVETSLAGNYTQKIDDSGLLLYDEGGVSVTYQKMMDSSIGTSFVLFVKNKSGHDILIQADDVSINDYMVPGCMSDPVRDGTVGYCELLIFEEYMERNDIDEIESLSFSLVFIDPINYATLHETGELHIQFS